MEKCLDKFINVMLSCHSLFSYTFSGDPLGPVASSIISCLLFQNCKTVDHRHIQKPFMLLEYIQQMFLREAN